MTRTERRHALAAAIRNHMEARGITQTQLAELFNLDKAQISRRCQGSASWPAEDLSILADILGAPLTFPAITAHA